LTPTVAGYGYSYKASYARLGLAVICDPGTLMLSSERLSARMSKTTNDGLTKSSIGCLAVPIRQQWVSKGAKSHPAKRYTRAKLVRVECKATTAY